MRTRSRTFTPGMDRRNTHILPHLTLDSKQDPHQSAQVDFGASDLLWFHGRGAHTALALHVMQSSHESLSQNPFLFSLSPRHKGSLDTAAKSLSREIMNSGGSPCFDYPSPHAKLRPLSSEAHLMRPILDLRTHLAYRIGLLRSLVVFLVSNGVAGHVSPLSVVCPAPTNQVC